jgi:hypothetical protein
VRPRHQFVRAAAGINNNTTISVVTVQALVATGAYSPHDHVISPVRGGHKRRTASVQVHILPHREDDGRWIGCTNAESRECAAFGAKSNIRALVSSVGGRCLDDVEVGDLL